MRSGVDKIENNSLQPSRTSSDLKLIESLRAKNKMLVSESDAVMEYAYGRSDRGFEEGYPGPKYRDIVMEAGK